MKRITTTAVLVLTAVVAVGMVFPAAAVPGAVDQANDQPGENISVGVGQQLSTVVSATTDEVRSEADDAGFEQRFSEAGATERAEAIAARADELDERAAELRTEYDELTADYRNGDLDGSAYAQRIATLTAKANAVERSTDRLADRATQLPDAERRAFDITEGDLDRITDRISPMTTRTTGAILAQFTAEGAGEIEIERNGGIELEVRNENGEQSRQFERPRDGNGSYVLTQSEALEIATDTLSEQTGAWVLTSASTDDGAYNFEFELHGPSEGEAELSVDGATGTVFELEESVESEDDDDDERLAIRITEGDPGPGAAVTLTVTADGQPVPDAAIELNDRSVGTTDENGTIAVTLPEGDVDIEATAGEREGELEFEFEDEREERSLGATADITDGTVTVSALLDGEPLEGASIVANGESVGTTGANGTVSFPLPADDELEIDVEYGELEAELEYELEEQDDDGDDEDEEEELSVSVTDGEPGPGESVTLTVTAGGERVAGATVELNGELAGQTDANGTITVTLPSEEVDIEVTDGEAEGELEFEFEDEQEDEEKENEDEQENEEKENEDEQEDEEEADEGEGDSAEDEAEDEEMNEPEEDEDDDEQVDDDADDEQEDGDSELEADDEADETEDEQEDEESDDEDEESDDEDEETEDEEESDEDEEEDDVDDEEDDDE